MSRALAIEPTTQSMQQRPVDGQDSKIQEKIKLRAYELFQSRGAVDGHHQDDWYQAEKEILQHDQVDQAA